MMKKTIGAFGRRSPFRSLADGEDTTDPSADGGGGGQTTPTTTTTLSPEPCSPMLYFDSQPKNADGSLGMKKSTRDGLIAGGAVLAGIVLGAALPSESRGRNAALGALVGAAGAGVATVLDYRSWKTAAVTAGACSVPAPAKAAG